MLGVFLDTEANGLNPSLHKILEIGLKILDLSTGETISSFESVVFISVEDWEKSDPASLEINGFTYEKVKAGSNVEVVSEEILDIFKKNKIIRNEAVFICQNPSFDRNFFTQLIDIKTQEKILLPYHWLDLASMYWSIAIKESEKNGELLPWVTGYTKDKIAKHFGIESEAQPHRAINGVNHLIECYEKVVGFPSKVTT